MPPVPVTAVIDKDDAGETDHVVVDKATFAALGLEDVAAHARFIAVHGQVAAVRVAESGLAPFTMHLSPVQGANLCVCSLQRVGITAWSPDGVADLDVVLAEMRPLNRLAQRRRRTAASRHGSSTEAADGAAAHDSSVSSSASSSTGAAEKVRLRVDGSLVRKQLAKRSFNRMLVANQRAVVMVGDGNDAVPFLVRYFMLYPEQGEADDGEAMDEDVGRGWVRSTTKVYLSLDMHHEFSQGVVMENQGDAFDPASRRKNYIQVATNDGEVFPVRKSLLRPCLALTPVLRDTTIDVPTVQVDIDCLTFDRVLLFLLDREGFQIPIQHAEALLAAAEALTLRSLVDRARETLGSFEGRKRIVRWTDVLQMIDEGRLVIVIDGMLVDVTQWLPFHPGGEKIIPEQALRKADCAYWFELYHATRESFELLKELYIGELDPVDRERLRDEIDEDEVPSDEFIEQLREMTHWRLDVGSTIFKSF